MGELPCNCMLNKGLWWSDRPPFCRCRPFSTQGHLIIQSVLSTSDQVTMENSTGNGYDWRFNAAQSPNRDVIHQSGRLLTPALESSPLIGWIGCRGCAYWESQKLVLASQFHEWAMFSRVKLLELITVVLALFAMATAIHRLFRNYSKCGNK